MDPTPKPLDENAQSVVLRGSCLCGMIHLESKMLPECIVVCHCRECRKASSNPFLTFGLFHNDYVQWLISTPTGGKRPLTGDLTDGIKLTFYSAAAVRGWCPRCGTPLFMKYHCRPDGLGITMGLVDDESTVGAMPPIKEHIFIGDKAAWWNVPDDDGIPKYKGFNESFNRRLKEWYSNNCPQRLDIPPSPFKNKL